MVEHWRWTCMYFFTKITEKIPIILYNKVNNSNSLWQSRKGERK